jgi:starch-binding outer membrane protein, SusD/RagB family
MKEIMKIKLLLFGLLALTFSGCKKFLEEDLQLVRSEDQIYTDPVFAQGFVLQAYRTMPPYYNNSDLATDDAVANLSGNAVGNAFRQIATGSWTPTNLTLSVWNGSYSAILYVNQFLAKSNKSRFANDPGANKLLNYRMRGEAFGLRALHMYFLLRQHGGVTADGQLMGVPIITDYQDPATTDFNQPRATFDACVKQIYRDLDSAEYYLPMEYVDLTAANQIPAQYASITQNPGAYNQAMGKRFRQLFNGLIAKSIRSRVALLAASPAFQHASNSATWEQAANAAAKVVRYRDSLAGVIGTGRGLPANGFTYYSNASEVDNLSEGVNPAEIIWREVRQTNNSDREAQNFPPTLFGNGLINPTQNLVEAFPTVDGYPISVSTTYSASNPYANRDPRLRTYIMYNAHPDYAAIRTGSQSGTADGINVRSTSTRTGYYLRKTLRSDVSLTPGSVTGKNRYTPRIRYTEIYLNYAEAANEAWGPKGNGPNGFSAYSVIKAIRQRAGVGGANDPYLEECAADPIKMRELIKNERRLELCFEGFRFWDIRRWNESLTKLNEMARGMDVNGSVYTPINVEERAYQSHMIYGPVPYSEVLKYSNLKQNAKW